jgi:hypothetical protein
MIEKCKICDGEIKKVFQKQIFNKYPVNYFQCTVCNFLQTEKPFWLQEAYSSAITSLDIGLLSRNIRLTNITSCVINVAFNPDGAFIDYAGGYGILVRLMRDKGYDFYFQDKYCENLFAKSFEVDIANFEGSKKYELMTAFEVFEHLEFPEEEIKKMFQYADSILFSTELLPEKNTTDLSSWWYIAPETGQHIAFYTEESLHILAKKLNTKYYKISNTLHLFTNKLINIKRLVKFEQNSKWRMFYTKFIFKKRNSLLESDYNSLIGRKVL